MPLLAVQFYVRRLGYFATGQAELDSEGDILAEFSEPVGWDFFELEESLEPYYSAK